MLLPMEKRKCNRCGGISNGWFSKIDEDGNEITHTCHNVVGKKHFFKKILCGGKQEVVERRVPVNNDHYVIEKRLESFDIDT